MSFSYNFSFARGDNTGFVLADAVTKYEDGTPDPDVA